MTARILLQGPTAGRLRFQPSRPAPSLPHQVPNEHAENTGTRKRRHPEEPPALDPLENTIRRLRSCAARGPKVRCYPATKGYGIFITVIQSNVLKILGFYALQCEGAPPHSFPPPRAAGAKELAQRAQDLGPRPGGASPGGRASASTSLSLCRSNDDCP